MNLNELTLENMGSWPLAVRIGMIGFLCVIIFGLFFIFDVRPMRLRTAQAVINENDLRSSFQVKYSQAVNRGAYVQQVKALNHQIKTILAELPDQLDIPELIGDISKVGAQAGVQFNFIKPKPEIKHNYYTTLPIEISITANYEQLTRFITSLAKIPRIVTVDHFSITRAAAPPGANTMHDSADPNNTLLAMELTAVTYKQNHKTSSKTTDEK